MELFGILKVSFILHNLYPCIRMLKIKDNSYRQVRFSYCNFRELVLFVFLEIFVAFLFVCLMFLFPTRGGSGGKESACSVGDLSLIPGSGRSPEEENGTHSSILASKIPWTGDPGGLQSMGSQRVEHD